MDLIVELPPTARVYNATVVFVDALSKMVHLAPTTTTATAVDVAQPFLERVVCLQGLPMQIISDRDPRFAGLFWNELLRLMGTKRSLSTAFHPQTGGQTERTNGVLEEMLPHFVNPLQINWDSLLPVAVFAINNAWQESIGNTPIFLNYGQHPQTPLTWTCAGESASKIPAVTQFVGRFLSC
jgi:hypothetical protein